MKMTPIDKKKCADLLRSMCDQREKEPHYADIRTEVNSIRKFADILWPPDKNAYAQVQWDALKTGLHWQGTSDELEAELGAGLVEMKERHQRSDDRDRKSAKPEIAY